MSANIQSVDTYGYETNANMLVVLVNNYYRLYANGSPKNNFKSRFCLIRVAQIAANN